MTSPPGQDAAAGTRTHSGQRAAATNIPQEADISAWKVVHYRIRPWMKLLKAPTVFLAAVVGVGSGYLALRFNLSSHSLGEALVTGAIVGGSLAWAQAVAAELKERRGLQIQLSTQMDLEWADLAEVDLAGVYLRRRVMNGIRLSRAYCYESDFSGSKLREARLTEGRFVAARFEGADLTAASCFNADLREAKMQGAHLIGVSFCGANLRGSDLTEADLRWADLRRADLREAVLANADLRGTWFSESTQWPIGFPVDVDELESDGLLFRKDDFEGAIPAEVLSVERIELDNTELNVTTG